MVNYEYQDYLKLYALLVGDKGTGEYGVQVGEDVVHRYYVVRLSEGEFVKKLSVIERFVDGTGDDFWDSQYKGWFGQSQLRLNLFMTYWERMQETGLRLVL